MEMVALASEREQCIPVAPGGPVYLLLAGATGDLAHHLWL